MATDKSYDTFLNNKSQLGDMSGFDPLWMPDFLFDFQTFLVDWAIRKGRAAIFADCGLGKSPCQLVWAQNVLQHTNKSVLIITPLAVSPQTVREGDKFNIECQQSRDGKYTKGIVVTNYERLHYFNPSDFAGVVCDESSAIKHFEAKRQKDITEFMRTMSYRLLCTATAAPNDYIELGTSSEALGELGRMDMLGRFFKNDENSLHPMWYGSRWRFKKHAEQHFWRWVCSWARACRKPSDLGFDDAKFDLPPLIQHEIIVQASRPRNGMLFILPAHSLEEQREERRMTIEARCQVVADKVDDGEQAVVWCHLNKEADLLEKMIPDAKQVSGADSDDSKEEKFLAFTTGELRVLVTKPKIGAFGLNWEHCAHMTMFPSHSFEQFYQGVRRCWRFGQKRPVVVDIVTTEGEMAVLRNLKRKAESADAMFTALVEEMNNEIKIVRDNRFTKNTKTPHWMSTITEIREAPPNETIDVVDEVGDMASHHPLRDAGSTAKAAVGISVTGWNKYNASGRRGRNAGKGR